MKFIFTIGVLLLLVSCTTVPSTNIDYFSLPPNCLATVYHNTQPTEAVNGQLISFNDSECCMLNNNTGICVRKKWEPSPYLNLADLNDQSERPFAKANKATRVLASQWSIGKKAPAKRDATVESKKPFSKLENCPDCSHASRWHKEGFHPDTDKGVSCCFPRCECERRRTHDKH